MLNVLAPIAETRSIPFFATESETKDCENRKFCSLFRNSADEWGQAVWQMLRAKEQKKIGIVKNQNQFMNTFVDAIIRNKNAEEIVEIWIDVPADVSDFRTSVLNLKNKNFDALGVFLLPNSHRAMLNALNNVNSRVQMFGVEEFLVKENNKGLEKLVEDTLIFTPAVSKKFNTDFTSRHGETAGYFYAVAAYDFMNLLAETIKNNPNLRKLELIKALHFKDQRIGEGGIYKLKFSKENVPFYSFPIAVHQLKSGKAVIVREIEF
jgi:ABC-type branched-subunit amino acid transport system substrate-binding protein